VIAPEEYQAAYTTALTLAEHGKARSVQTDGGLLGASDAGGCVHKAVLTVRRTPPTNIPRKGKALIGSALHKVFLDQIKDAYPERHIEIELPVRLPSGTEIPLHPDEIDPDEPSVTDFKFVEDLNYRRREGVTEQQHMQRNLQYLAAHQAGLVPAEGIVRNLFVSMTDAEDVWVQQEPFSMEWVERADEWFAEVRYGVEHDEDGRKDAQPYFCESYCPFYSLCKPLPTDAFGKITSPALIQRADLALDARQQRKHFEKIEKEAVEQLRGLTGSTDRTTVVSTTVNAQRGSYVKVDLRERAP
jgi:hypothetical protein